MVLAGACSGKPSIEPTEENIHAGDLRPVGPMTDTHVFRCGDGSRLLVQFRRGAAPTISIRERPGATPDRAHRFRQWAALRTLGNARGDR